MIPDPRLTLRSLQVLRALDRVYPLGSYGFEIVQLTSIPSGTVYPVLTRLRRSKFVWSMRENGSAARLRRPLRRLYFLTNKGRQAFQQAMGKLECVR